MKPAAGAYGQHRYEIVRGNHGGVSHREQRHGRSNRKLEIKRRKQGVAERLHGMACEQQPSRAEAAIRQGKKRCRREDPDDDCDREDDGDRGRAERLAR
jgi:hypothetical protein